MTISNTMPSVSLWSLLLTNINLPVLPKVELRRRGGSDTPILMPERVRVLVHVLLRKMFCREVRRVLRAEDLSQLNKPAELLLLQPQDANV